MTATSEPLVRYVAGMAKEYMNLSACVGSPFSVSSQLCARSSDLLVEETASAPVCMQPLIVGIAALHLSVACVESYLSFLAGEQVAEPFRFSIE